MNFPFYIARRYLLAKKRTHLINVISALSAAGLAIGTIGLIIGLSGFNGFDSLIKSLFSSFDPDLKITLVEGKHFDPETAALQRVKQMKEVAYYTDVVEDQALLRYQNRQVLATMKGVSDNYQKMTGLDSMMVEGHFTLQQGIEPQAILGQGLAYSLSAGIHPVDPIQVYVPQKGRNTSLSLAGNFNQGEIYPSGIFSVQQELDTKYIIVPLSFARQVFNTGGEISALELKLQKGIAVDRVQESIKQQLGPGFLVKNRYQQHDYLYRTMQGEKYAVYLILILILVIASFNVVGSLTMLILDKKEDIAILRSMGADQSTIRKIFLLEGWSVSIVGAVVGTFVGLILCQAQISYGLVKLQGGGSFIIETYPMKIVPVDIVLIFGSVVLIGFLAAWLPVKYISGHFLADESH